MKLRRKIELHYTSYKNRSLRVSEISEKFECSNKYVYRIFEEIKQSIIKRKKQRVSFREWSRVEDLFISTYHGNKSIKEISDSIERPYFSTRKRAWHLMNQLKQKK